MHRAGNITIRSKLIRRANIQEEWSRGCIRQFRVQIGSGDSHKTFGQTGNECIQIAEADFIHNGGSTGSRGSRNTSFNRKFTLDPGIDAATEVADIGIAQQAQGSHTKSTAMPGGTIDHNRLVLGGELIKVIEQFPDGQVNCTGDVTGLFNFGSLTHIHQEGGFVHHGGVQVRCRDAVETSRHSGGELRPDCSPINNSGYRELRSFPGTKSATQIDHIGVADHFQRHGENGTAQTRTAVDHNPLILFGKLVETGQDGFVGKEDGTINVSIAGNFIWAAGIHHDRCLAGSEFFVQLGSIDRQESFGETGNEAINGGE